VNVRTSTVENLLRVARSEAAAGTAFVAVLDENGDPPQIVTVAAPGTSDVLSPDDLAHLARQAAADPEFAHTGVFVRSVQMGRSRTLVVAPLRDGDGRSMIGVVAEPDLQLEPAQLEVLERLAQRLVRHLQVVRQLEDSGELKEAFAGGSAGGAPEVPPSGRTRPLAGVQEVPETRGPGPAPKWTRLPESPDVQAPDQEHPPPGTSAAAGEASPATWWADPDPISGLANLGQFFSRAGRMLAPDDRTTGALALVVVEVPDPRTMPGAAEMLRSQLRFSDPVARVDHDLLAAAMLLVPSGSADAVEQRLVASVRSALERPGVVRSVHVVAEPGGRRDVDELLRQAISLLPGRQAGGGGAPWRGAGGSAARLPIP